MCAIQLSGVQFHPGKFTASFVTIPDCHHYFFYLLHFYFVVIVFC